jgi:hypothetical protein
MGTQICVTDVICVTDAANPLFINNVAVTHTVTQILGCDATVTQTGSACVTV